MTTLRGVNFFLTLLFKCIESLKFCIINEHPTHVTAASDPRDHRASSVERPQYSLGLAWKLLRHFESLCLCILLWILLVQLLDKMTCSGINCTNRASKESPLHFFREGPDWCPEPAEEAPGSAG
nr:uncharacterized protein LOC129154695 isoform X2 [Nothobranchius furzeri]